MMNLTALPQRDTARGAGPSSSAGRRFGRTSMLGGPPQSSSAYAEAVKLFECQHCGQLLDFENTRCERCGHVLGYLSAQTILSALEPVDGRLWRPLAMPEQLHRFCANAVYDACNWLVSADFPGTFCHACRLNRTIPNLAIPEQLARWQRLESAKHRLVYGLLRLRLPLAGEPGEPSSALAFDFLADADPSFRENGRVMTGHARG